MTGEICPDPMLEAVLKVVASLILLCRRQGAGLAAAAGSSPIYLRRPEATGQVARGGGLCLGPEQVDTRYGSPTFAITATEAMRNTSSPNTTSNTTAA